MVPPMLCPILPLSQRSRSVALHIPVAAGSRSLVAKGGENMRTQRLLARLLEGKKARRPGHGVWLVRSNVTDGWRSRCQTAGVFLTMVPDAGCTA